jgi:hypothetical protein
MTSNYCPALLLIAAESRSDGGTIVRLHNPASDISQAALCKVEPAFVPRERVGMGEFGQRVFFLLKEGGGLPGLFVEYEAIIDHVPSTQS